MGQGESKFLSQQKQLGKEFTVDSRVKQENLTFLTNRQSHKQFLLREIVYTAEPEYRDMIKRLEQCKAINCPFVTQLHRLEYYKEENLCSNYYRIYSLWEYPRKTLAEEITYRALLKQPFQSAQIRSFMIQMAEGLSILEQSSKSHECLTTKSILMAPDNSIKVVGVLALPSHPNLEIVYQKRNTKNTYLSPQHCKIIASGEFSQSIPNPSKDDVFIAGMILLQCALLERQDDCYAHNWEAINWDKVHEKLWSVQGRYGSELRGVVEQMLQENAERRISWQGIINRLQPRPSLRPNQIKTTQIGQSFIRETVQSHLPLRVSLPPPLIVTQTVRRDPRNNFSFSYANSQSPVHIPARVERVGYTQGPVIRVSQPTSIIRRIVPQNFHNQLPPVHLNLVFASNNVRQIPIETSMSSKFTPIAISSRKPRPQTIPTAIPPNHHGFITTVNNQFKINTPTLQEVNPPLPPEIKNFSLHIADPIYSIDQYAEGKRYEGYKVNGKKEGEGKFYLDNKLCFDGHWKDDLMEGQGRLYYQSGVLAYDGNFEKDRFHGFGRLYNQAPQQLTQAYNYQNFEDIEEYWVSYEGYFQDDLKEGKGELFLTNGQHFEGNFHIDFVEGEGIYTAKQGKKIHGIWHQNILQKILE